ncbi:MAG: MoxR family ATPase [Flavobacteriales bacterium]|nr:MoxR family ATPase [Flavobacteriales bacterium]
MNKKEQFKDLVIKAFGNLEFSKKSAREICDQNGFTQSEWKSIYNNVLRKIKTGKAVYTFEPDHVFETKVKKPTDEVVKKEKKKVLNKDWEVLNEEVVKPVVDETAKKWENIAMAAKDSFKESPTTFSLIPKKDPQYVSWGHFKDIKSILESKVFYPIFVTGLSGNGKTSMIREVCAKLKRDMIRINITVETDEDDLLGGFRLVNGETVWQDGPLVVAMKNGAVALIDEVDLASHKIMCLQPIMEGQPIYLKKINQLVTPVEGFNIVATANTKGKGSSDGRFMGTNILNEAFLDRFSATFYQEYPSVAHETKILKKQFSLYDIVEDDFVEKLVKWADVIRKSFKEGAVEDIVTTRRLIDITKSFSIFKDKMKSVTMCLERFDDETRDSFADLYTKIDSGVSLEDLNKVEEEVSFEEDNKEEEVPF